MRTIQTLLTAALLLILTACHTTDNPNTSNLPEPTITSINPTTITPNTEITITGTGYYTTNTQTMTAEVCGVTTNAHLIEPITQRVTLPPGSAVTIHTGTSVTLTILEDGFQNGEGQTLTLTRPDGLTVQHEGITCAPPDPDPTPEPDPDPDPTPDPDPDPTPDPDPEPEPDPTPDPDPEPTPDPDPEPEPDPTPDPENPEEPGDPGEPTDPETPEEPGDPTDPDPDPDPEPDPDPDPEPTPDPDPDPDPDPEPTPVTASITTSATTAVAPATITFNAKGSTGEGELQYHWSFGVEEATATGAEVTYEYQQPGTYTITLTVTDETGATAEATQEVVIHPPLRAVIEHSEVTRYAPVTVSFDGTGSTGITPLTYAWDFGDETGTSTEAEPQYEYEQPGTYTVALTVTDASGSTDTAEVELIIPAATPVNAVITADPIIGTAPLTVNFSALNSTGEGELKYDWQFGTTGANSSEAEPEYTFEVGGTYEVTLTVTDETGTSNTTIQAIAVDVAPASISFTVEPTDLLPNSEVLVESDNYSTTVTLPDGTLSDLPPGTYTITPQEHERTESLSGQKVTSNWTAAPQTITVTEGETQTVTLEFTPEAGALSFTQAGLPNPVDYSDTITIEALSTPLGLPASTGNLNELVPGLYELTATMIPVQTGNPANNTAFTTEYEPLEATVHLVVNSGDLTEHEINYRIIPVGSITLNAGDTLPSGTEPNAILLGSPGLLPQPWVDVPPGQYLLSFYNVDHVNENGIERDNGEWVDAFETYEADSRIVYLSSGEDATFGVDYTLQEALLEISIEAPAGENTADVTITDASGTEHHFTSATNEDLYIPLGEYHVEFNNPSGYRVTGARSSEGFNLADTSHGYLGGKTSFSVFVKYEPVTPPEITTFEADSPVTHLEPTTFTWEVNNPQSNPLTCTLDPGDNTPPHEIDCSHNGMQHTYSQPGEYEATLTVTDNHNNTHSATTTVVVNNPPAPVIYNFTNSTP